MTKHIPLFVLLIVYVIVGALYAVRTPAWQAPDEPAHYNYAAQVAANGCCPVIAMGDWDSAYLDTLKAERFAPDLLDRLATVQYEDHQPPLYYLLSGLVYRLTDGSLTALRLLSVLISAGILACAYAITLALLPDRRALALAAALLAGFIPQNLAIMASVNNDALAGLIVGVTLYLLIRYLQGARVPVWALGVAVGVGLLTKVNTIFLAGLVPLFVLLHWWFTPDRRFVELTRRLVLFAVPALILGGLWWLRNLGVYGFPDVFGLRRHDQVVVGQLRTAELIAQVGLSEYLRRAVDTTFTSFFGQFGWMGLFMPTWAYWIVLAFLGVVVIGWIVAYLGLRTEVKGLSDKASASTLANQTGKSGLSPQSSALSPAFLSWVLLALTVILAGLQYLYYNTEFVQFQGRYLYPALIPLALFAALGVDGWRHLLARLIGDRPSLMWLTPLIAALFIPLSLFMIWRVIPQLAP
jgi:4-amino-4-deoxy-L-arabinose transferase-like glycosyltransferase